jgi:hypothetical protein
MKVAALTTLALLIVANVIHGQSSKDLQADLTKKEQLKIEKFNEGKISDIKDLFGDDFTSIAFYQPGKIAVSTKQQLVSFPALPIKLQGSDFRLIRATGDCAILTYVITAGTIKVYATSIWAKRNGKWLSVFYQDSMTQ